MTEQNPEVYEEFLNHLHTAERSAMRALDLLYKLEDGVNRGLAYKLRLGNAQSILMSLYVRELNQKEDGGPKYNWPHEWEHLGANVYECVHCEKQTTSRTVNGKKVYVSDILRRIPKYGRRYRCV